MTINSPRRWVLTTAADVSMKPPPWPHFPHCPQCHRRLYWANRGMPVPTEVPEHSCRGERS